MATDSNAFETLVARHAGPGMAPLVINGCWDALSARIIANTGQQAACVDRRAVARALLGDESPELATVNMMLAATAAIGEATDLALCVDIGDGFGNAFNVARTARNMRRAGAQALQLSDDLVEGKNPSVRRNTPDMIGKIKALTDAVSDFAIVARTARGPEEADNALADRCCAYAEAGAHIVLLAGLPSLDALARIADQTRSLTPLAIECDELIEHWCIDGVIMVCQPLRFQRQLETAGIDLLRGAAAAQASFAAK